MQRVALNDLEAVLAVARRRSFRAAAIDLDMSTTALSQAIARLEANLGVRLFNRTTRSVSLSNAGRLLRAQGEAEKPCDEPTPFFGVNVDRLYRGPHRKGHQCRDELQHTVWQDVILDGFANQGGNAGFDRFQKSVQFRDEVPVCVGRSEPNGTTSIELINFVNEAFETLLRPRDAFEGFRGPFGHRWVHLFPDMGTTGRNQ